MEFLGPLAFVAYSALCGAGMGIYGRNNGWTLRKTLIVANIVAILNTAAYLYLVL